MFNNGPADLVIRPAVPADAGAVAAIYNHYVVGTVVTFEEEAVSDEEVAGRIAKVQSTALPWLVAEKEARIVGYAYAMRWQPRSAYRYSAEISAYLDSQYTGQGIGSALYGALIPALKGSGLHTAIGIIALPNAGSVALHEKYGMQKVAHIKEVGFKFERWIDVGYWQGQL